MGLIQLAYVVSETGRRELAVIRKILEPASRLPPSDTMRDSNDAGSPSASVAPSTAVTSQ